jgi:acetyltransferase-like isoleucine patch superfamily enzyme/glycosyltransferase involved in cell wall biosynthesis
MGKRELEMILEPFKSRGYDVTIWPEAKIVQTENISVGNHVIVDDFCFIVGGQSTYIGDHVHIASFVSITGGGSLVVEDFCGISSGTRIFTGDDDYKGGCLTNPTVPAPYRKPKRSFVRIEKHALIGANCVILAGVTVGQGCAIGAGSIVLKDTEPWSIYAGNPARKIGNRPKEEILRLEYELLHHRPQHPLVSVCCCTYNQAKLIRSALDSFLIQKCSFPFEILVHDDASRDGTPVILEEYRKKNPDLMRIFLQKENQFSRTGKYPVFNLYKEAKGKYIAECDGDDYWTDPYKLQKQVDFLESNPDYVMCHHDYVIEQDGKTRRPDPTQPKDYSAAELVGYNSEGYGIGLCTRMFRNLYNSATAKDIEQMVGDYPMVVYLGTAGKCKYIPGVKPSVYRRMNGTNSWCSLPPAEMAKRTAAMQKNIYEFFRRKNDPNGMEMRRKFVERRLWQ